VRTLRAWMTTATSDLLLPGYWVDEDSGRLVLAAVAYRPRGEVALARSSLGPQIIDWSEGRTDEPGLWHYMHRTPVAMDAGQKRFLILWYALDDDGRFVYRSGVKRGAKGTGKDPMLAAMCNAELLGPVEPHDRDDRTGLWVGQPAASRWCRSCRTPRTSRRRCSASPTACGPRRSRALRPRPGETRTIIKGTGARFEVPTAAESPPRATR
jgi:hypothetical protein